MKWSIPYTKDYGKGYDYTNLSRFRKFYLCFPIVAPLEQQLSWTHYRYILPIKNENERNYYINLCITNHLSKRELIQEIKNKSFDRLSYADKENIRLIEPDNYSLTIEDMIKDPIIIKTNNVDNLSEKALHQYIIKMLENRFLELGVGFTLAGHEYKIKVEGHTFSLDLLFFNFELNCFVAIEIKLNNPTVKDIDQTKFYVELVNDYVKKQYHNPTIGIIISKEKNRLVIKYATGEDIYVTTYKLIENK